MVALTHWVYFLFFLRELHMIWPPCLSVMFRRLVRLCSFPTCWREAHVTPIPKGPPSSSVANYRPISITSVLSQVFERQLPVRLRWFMKRNGVIPTTQFSYRKGLCTCDAFLSVSHTLQVHWRSGGWDYTDWFQQSLSCAAFRRLYQPFYYGW